MSLSRQLNANELRVLGALIEKSLTTPDQYPLTVNSLRNACNQKSSRDPIMALDERDVHQALRDLQELKLARESLASGRAVRWEHRAREVLEVSPSELAALCVLMLRGAQTPGEIRSRSGRLFDFVDRADVERTIERLAGREPPMVTQLRRAPGQKEQRYAHLLGDTVADAAPQTRSSVSTAARAPAQSASDSHGVDETAPAPSWLEERFEALEQRLSELERIVATRHRHGGDGDD